MARGRDAAKAMVERKSAGQGAAQRGRTGTEGPRRVRRNVTFVAPLQTPWRVKPQQQVRSETVATLNHVTGSTWRRDVDEVMTAFTAAVATPGPHSHALPPRPVAEALSHQDADRW
jgi:hypothetical protein